MPMGGARAALSGSPWRTKLVGYWPCDEASGTRRDVSGNGITLTDNNTVTGNPGPSANIALASQFTLANSEYLSVADDDRLDMGTGAQMTLCAWVYLDSAPAAVLNIVSKFNASGNQRGYAMEWNNVTNRMNLLYSVAGTSAVTLGYSSLVISTATWYFFTVTYDGVNFSLNVNGGTPIVTATTGDIFATTTPFQIGLRGATTLYWDGRICGVGLWKRVLTATELAFLYNGGSGRSSVELGLTG